eukprot:5834464-Alexandrium_andersonii.AAC.1
MSSGTTVCRPAFDFVKGLARTVGGGACVRDGSEVFCDQAAMERLREFYSRHFRSCGYAGEDNA